MTKKKQKAKIKKKPSKKKKVKTRKKPSKKRKVKTRKKTSRKQKVIKKRFKKKSSVSYKEGSICSGLIINIIVTSYSIRCENDLYNWFNNNSRLNTTFYECFKEFQHSYYKCTGNLMDMYANYNLKHCLIYVKTKF